MIRLLCTTVLLALSLSAAPILTLNPSNGNLTALPGETVYWGFTIQSDPLDWIVFTSVQTTLAVPGTYIDQLSNFVSNNAFALAPQSADWTDISTPGSALVAGAIAMYDIAPAAPFGLYNGILIAAYDRYDADPFVSANATFLGSGELIRNVSITLTDPSGVPEPATILLTGLPLALLALRRFRQCMR